MIAGTTPERRDHGHERGQQLQELGLLLTAPDGTDPSKVPGALQELKQRDLPDGSGVVEFEFAPAGWLNDAGEVRLRDHRAYYWTPAVGCSACDGTGREPSVKRPGRTIQCKACKGSGVKRGRVISVTTLLDSISPKPGLPPWYEARGIEGAVEAMRLGEITERTDPAHAVKVVRAMRLGADRARDDAADRGLNVHAVLERYMVDGSFPNPGAHPVPHRGYLRALARFLLRRRPEPVSVEELVCDAEAGYAGRRDLVAMAAGRRVGWDAKTQEKGGIFSSAHTQLGLYERAAVKGGDVPCDDLMVVVFSADGEYREMPCRATPEVVQRALDYYQAVRPVDAECSRVNRAEKESRKGVAA